MSKLKIIAMPTDIARAFQRGGLDAHGMAPERGLSDGPGNPCRHCLDTIEAGTEKLVLAYRPFEKAQPFAEVGPIFLHARECCRHDEMSGWPEMFMEKETLLVRGYGVDNRIQYGVARHIPPLELEEQCLAMLKNPDVAYLHVRSSTNNCFQCRVERG